MEAESEPEVAEIVITCGLTRVIPVKVAVPDEPVVISGSHV